MPIPYPRRQAQMSNQLSSTSWQTLLRKSVVWGIWLFLLAVLQTSFFSVIRVFGAVPDLVLPAVITIAIYDRERMGTVAGIMGGYIADALGGTGLSLSPLVYMLCGIIVALLAYSALCRDFLSWLVGTVLSLALSGGASVISAYFAVGTVHFGASDIFSEMLVPQFFASLAVGIPVYFVTKAIWSRFFDNREMEG